jgi:hypothetical protein
VLRIADGCGQSGRLIKANAFHPIGPCACQCENDSAAVRMPNEVGGTLDNCFYKAR